MIGSLLFRISPRWSLAYWTFVARVRYGPVSNVRNAFYFAKLAWHFLCGRLLVITTEEPESNGGYRYFALVISKRPVSSKHRYDDL